MQTMNMLRAEDRRREAFDVAFTKFSEHAEVLQHLGPLQGHGKGKALKGKEKATPGIAVPDDCEIFVDGKQLCKQWQVGRCTAKVKPGKRCMVGYHMCWKKACHKLHPGNERPH